MLKVPFNTIIKESIRRTKTILFIDFSLKKWLKLLFIAYLAGSITAGFSGGGNFSPKNVIRDKNEQKEEKPTAAKLIILKKSEEIGKHSYLKQTDFRGKFFIEKKSFRSQKDDFFRKIKNNSFWIFGLIFLSLFCLALMILFIWLNARFKFIWLNSIINNTSNIRRPFKKYKTEGNSLFKILIFLPVTILSFIVLIAWWVYPKINNLLSISQSKEVVPAIFSFLAPAAIFIFGMIIFSFIYLFVNQFIVAIMAQKRSKFMFALKDFFRIINKNRKDFFFYILLIIGLLMLTSLISFVLLIIVFLLVLFAGGVFFGLFYLIIAVLLKAKLIYFIFLALTGIPFLLAVLFLLISVKLPFATFYRCFSLYFLSSLETSLNILPIEDESNKST